MELPQRERDMMMSFLKYAMDSGDIPITIKNFSGSNREEA